jgi:predicted hydrocarbon binding protein
LLSRLTGPSAASADWLGDVSQLVKTVHTVSWDLRVEEHGQTLIPPRGPSTYFPLLDDYLRIAVSLFPDLRRHLDLDPALEIDAVLDSLRHRLGVDHPEPDDFKLFYLTSGGRMQNVKDDSPNISFKVATFQSLLDTLWERVSAAGLPKGLGPALTDAGRIAGAEFGRALTELVSEAELPTEDLVRLWCGFDSQVGWGRLEAEFGDVEGRAEPGVLRVWHNAFAEGRSDDEDSNDLCTFMSGYISGVLTELIGREVTVTHNATEPCIRRGADHCAFRFTV